MANRMWEEVKYSEGLLSWVPPIKYLLETLYLHRLPARFVDPKGALNAHDAGAKDGSSPWPTLHQEGNTLRLGDALHLDQRPRQFGRSAFAPFSPSSACHQLQFFQEAPQSRVKGRDCGGEVLVATWGHEFCLLGPSFPRGEMEEADPLRCPQPPLRGFRTWGLTAGPHSLWVPTPQGGFLVRSCFQGSER